MYDIIQYLPLDKLGIKDKYNIIDIVNQIVMKEKKWDKIKDSLKKEEKENLFKLKYKLKIEAPILLDAKVDSAKAIVTFTDKNTGTIIKELPIDITKGSTTISYDKDVNYTDKAQELLADAIKNNRVLVSITIQSVTTQDGTKTLKQ